MGRVAGDKFFTDEERAARRKAAKAKYAAKPENADKKRARGREYAAMRLEDPVFRADQNELQRERKRVDRADPEHRAERNSYEVSRQVADRAKNPEKYREYSRTSMRKAGAGGWPVPEGSVCALCGSPGRGEQWTCLVMDHDHATGKLREPLCRRCNLSLGHLEVDTEWTYRTIEYLDRPWVMVLWRRAMAPVHHVACEMCWAPDAPGKGHRLVQDHSHYTRGVRGVLCPRCNKRLGFVERDRAWTGEAMAYIESHRVSQ